MSRTAGGTEGEWERYAIELLVELGWRYVPGHDIAPGGEERQGWADLHVPSRMFTALRRLNPDVPTVYLQQTLVEVCAPRSSDAITENHRVHEWLTRGYRGTTYVDDDGQEVTPTIRLMSADPDENEWLVVDQVTVRRGEHHRRFDLVLYCNGMPVSIIELKQAGRRTADLAAAHAQLATYLEELPLVFRFAVLTLVSDGITARYGTPFTPLNHYSPWNVDDDGKVLAPGSAGQDGQPVSGMELALAGVYNQERFVQLMRSFTVFDEGGGGLSKRIAKPHQYFAVTKAVASAVQAVESDGRAGVVWHTQGSGKSMEMELFTHQVMRHPKLLNPTVVVITDRTELDGQLFDGFDASLLLPEKPQQVKRRSQLREELSGRATGGIYFTTLQKFGLSKAERDAGTAHPLLSDRRNIVVVVDEAHRSHYDDLDGYARHLRDALPRATLIAFTGTPISSAERDTQAVFGDYVDVYDLTRAVEDGATVPVYFEPRLVRMTLRDGVTQDDIDRAADEAASGLDLTERAQVERSVAVVNAVYGAPERLAVLADDVIAHWEARRAALRPLISAPGKAIVVGATREICARLYEAIVERRPGWHSDDLASGRIKVVYSGSASDIDPVSRHVRRGSENAAIKERLRDVDDELEIVIVKDMMLTGYDSPPLHTLYLDRPLKGALLMQTLARVNRTFRGKDSGLLVSYAPLADDLQKALAEYSSEDRDGKPLGRDVSEAVALVEALLGEIRPVLAGYDWRSRLDGRPRGFVTAALGATNHLRDPATAGNQVEEGEESLGDRFRRSTGQLARGWALCTGSSELVPVRNEVQFYEEVRTYMAKFDAEERRTSGQPVPEEIARLLAAVLDDSTQSGEVLDIYAAAGLPSPALSDLTPAYAEQARGASNPHLAIEALRAMVLAEAGRVTRNNVVRERLFSERVTELMTRYTNAQLTAAEVIAELIELAREVRAESARGAAFTPPLDDDELALYDAVATNESAVREQGDHVLAQIARDLVTIMQRDVRTDWTVRDDVRAKLRTSIKRLLVKHGYPPDRQPTAIKLVIEQMENLAPRFGERGRDGAAKAHR